MVQVNLVRLVDEKSGTFMHDLAIDLDKKAPTRITYYTPFLEGDNFDERLIAPLKSF